MTGLTSVRFGIPIGLERFERGGPKQPQGLSGFNQQEEQVGIQRRRTVLKNKLL